MVVYRFIAWSLISVVFPFPLLSCLILTDILLTGICLGSFGSLSYWYGFPMARIPASFDCLDWAWILEQTANYLIFRKRMRDGYFEIWWKDDDACWSDNDNETRDVLYVWIFSKNTQMYWIRKCTELLHNMLLMMFRVTPMPVSFSESYLINDPKLVLLWNQRFLKWTSAMVPVSRPVL